MDFIRAVILTEKDKAILALPSRTNKGIPGIVPTLKLGASVVITRAHVQYIVTEYGVEALYTKNLKERVKQMIEIAYLYDRPYLCEKLYDDTRIMI